MSIEALLERIAVATETVARTITTPAPPVPANVPSGEAMTSPPPATEPRKRGRPPKVETPVAPPADTGIDFGDAPADDDFLSEAPVAPPKEVTKVEVRDALVALQERTGNPETARALLKRVGSADSLGTLAADKFAAVIEAANAA